MMTSSNIQTRQPVAPSLSSSSYMSSQPLRSTQSTSCSLPTLTKSFVLQKTLQIAQNDARVMSYDKHNMMLVASKPSPNQLFPGYGVLKVSSLESRTSEYIRIHQKPIRDMTFSPDGDQLLLTASVDKTLKLTSVLSNSVVQSYTCPAPVWACAWNTSNSNYVYAGPQNGTCCVYDTRKTEAILSSLKPRVGVPCPIVSLDHIGACAR